MNKFNKNHVNLCKKHSPFHRCNCQLFFICTFFPHFKNNTKITDFFSENSFRNYSNNKMKKVHVSYVSLVVYIIVVLLISLLIALLASLAGVKRSNCGDESAALKVIADIMKMEKPNQETPRTKRNAVIREKLRGKAFNNEFIRMKLAGKPFKANDDCPEFLQYQNGTLWESIKLPSYVRPTKYDIELYTPSFNSETYAGVSSITIELDQDTNVIIFHSTSVDIVSGDLFDKANKAIEIKCGGYYPLNDYYVIITKNPILKSSSPLKLDLVYVGELSQSEAGLFDLPYEGGQSRYKNIIFIFFLQSFFSYR
jgi:hypothetical protein